MITKITCKLKIFLHTMTTYSLCNINMSMTIILDSGVNVNVDITNVSLCK